MVVGGWVGLFSWVDELMDECSWCAVQVVFCLPQKRQKKIPRVRGTRHNSQQKTTSKERTTLILLYSRLLAHTASLNQFASNEEEELQEEHNNHETCVM
jgi:hypothetical protein